MNRYGIGVSDHSIWILAGFILGFFGIWDLFGTMLGSLGPFVIFWDRCNFLGFLSFFGIFCPKPFLVWEM